MTSEWIVTTIGKFCPFKYGKGLPKRDRETGNFSVFSSAGLIGTHTAALVNTPGVIVGRKGTIGSINFSANPFWAIDTTFYIEDEPKVRDIHYTYYLLKTLGLNLMNTDSAVPGLNRENAHALEIRVPLLKEQKTIANFLIQLDNRITSLREINSTLEEIVQTIFKSWFIDFDPVKAKLNSKQPEGIDKFSATLFPDKFEQSELGEIPRGWQVRKILSIVSESTERVGNNLPTVLSAVQTGDLVKSSDYFKKKVHSKNISQYKAVPPFYFAYNPARINIGSIGINETNEIGAVSPVYVVAAPISNYFAYYLWHHLRTGYMKEIIRNMASGSVRQNLSYDDFSNIPLVLPPENIVRAFFNIRSKMYESVKCNQAMIKTLVNTKEILLPKLISGQLRLNKVEKNINNKLRVSTQ